MELDTKERTVAASRQKIGIEVIEIAAGQELKIEAGPGEMLNTTCPAGKSWTAQITVIINEIDG